MLLEIIDLDTLHKAAQVKTSPITGGSDKIQSKDLYQSYLERGAESFGVECSSLAIGGISAVTLPHQAIALWDHWGCNDWVADIHRAGLHDPFVRLWWLAMSYDRMELRVVPLTESEK